jgi:superfamily II DNA helicase RecQ
MQLRFFTIPTLRPEPAASELNHCLATQRVAQVDKTLVADGSNSHWSVCVTLVDTDVSAPRRMDERSDSARRRNAVDYREVLPPADFALYDRLRDARKQAAEAEGLPTYAVFTNEQLAAMVTGRVTSAAGLATIEGVGEARVQRYGPRFLPLLQAGVPGLPARAGAPPPSADAALGPTAGRA